MKVVVHSTPRTCSYFMLNLFCQHFKLHSYVEHFANSETLEETKIRWANLQTKDNYGVKITSTTFQRKAPVLTYDTFPWEMYDYVILTERDIVQQTASWILLFHLQMTYATDWLAMPKDRIREMLNNPSSIAVPDHIIPYIIENVSFYYNKTKPFLMNSNIPVHVVKYEQFQGEPEEYLPILQEEFGIDFTIDELINLLPRRNGYDYTPLIEEYNLAEQIDQVKNWN